MNSATPLGRFLTSRRARVTPAEAGLPALGRRRVPGLRREEAAELAGVSVVYYTRLEQGRAGNPSDAVLDALARVLRLDATEHAHLHDLARQAGRRAAPALADRRRDAIERGDGTPAGRDRPGAEPGASVREELRRLLTAVGAVPAYVLSPAMDVLAANDLALAVVGGPDEAQPGQLNLAHHVFLDASAQELYPRWAEVARQTVGFLRFCAGRRPEDARLAAVVAELSSRSPEFREMWATRDVREKTYGTKAFRHPVAGGFDLAYETLVLPGDEGSALVVFTAPDAGAEAALRLLGRWAASAGAPGLGRLPAGSGS
ncbi:helix-turn-helix domain-containing protein [Streptomyces erythrochromogenes]|uniref:helix-turn-helix domain-containing protein n=1 Tax=Streptomyces erythrochromogenes TaxID=285574 RepID=UPI00380F262F